jgi:electron transfer flavoprotein alpha subunit
MSTLATAVTASAEAVTRRAEVFVVLEPGDENGEGGSPTLMGQGVRLARALGVTCAALSWAGDQQPEVESLASAIVDVVRKSKPQTLLLADSDVGRQLAPMIALDLSTSAVLGCSDILVRGGDVVYVKPVHGGWLEREISFPPDVVQVATVEPAVVPTGSATSSTPDDPIMLEIEGAEKDARGERSAPRVIRLELVPPDFRTVDIVHAKRIVAVGAGGASDELLAAVGELAELLQGSVGTTRPVVDDGRLPKERLIGQTGKTVAPDLYVALGISGSPHHVSGIQGAKRILAVNKDAHAPILLFSDTGYIGNLETVLPALLQRIKEWRDGEGGSDARGA